MTKTILISSTNLISKKLKSLNSNFHQKDDASEVVDCGLDDSDVDEVEEER